MSDTLSLTELVFRLNPGAIESTGHTYDPDAEPLQITDIRRTDHGYVNFTVSNGVTVWMADRTDGVEIDVTAPPENADDEAEIVRVYDKTEDAHVDRAYWTLTTNNRFDATEFILDRIDLRGPLSEYVSS